MVAVSVATKPEVASFAVASEERRTDVALSIGLGALFIVGWAAATATKVTGSWWPMLGLMTFVVADTLALAQWFAHANGTSVWSEIRDANRRVMEDLRSRFGRLRR